MNIPWFIFSKFTNHSTYWLPKQLDRFLYDGGISMVYFYWTGILTSHNHKIFPIPVENSAKVENARFLWLVTGTSTTLLQAIDMQTLPHKVLVELIHFFSCSIVELIQGGEGGLSVLRTFRLLRILKLVRFLPALRYQLVIMLKTMDNVATFFALLILFIFIFRWVVVICYEFLSIWWI